MNAPEPAAETGLNTHFGNTMAPASKPASKPTNGASSTTSPRSPLSSDNPFRDSTNSPKHSPPTKTGANVSERSVSRESFPRYREEAFGGYSGAPRHRSASGAARRAAPPPSYEDVTGGSSGAGRRRGSSLRERYPGDDSHKPLDIIRRDSKKAHRSPHLNKRHIPGADIIDRLDPAVGGVAYHHEGPYDAATLARNTSYETSPIAALKESNEEAIKATPAENIKDALERHKPLDGVAVVPPGMPDRFGRTYNYEEGPDVMLEASSDNPGYKRWPGKVRSMSICTYAIAI
jgi:hypothetical protein